MQTTNYRPYTTDKTLDRKCIKLYKELIIEYEQVKEKKHPKYKFAKDFYKDKGLCFQNFLKYYNRYKQTSSDESLLPQRRGPKYKTILSGVDKIIESRILTYRAFGHNRYVICEALRREFGDLAPSLSTTYNRFKKNGVNKLKAKKTETVKKIIKENIGDLGHIDCFYLPKGIVDSSTRKDYLVAIIDDHSRIAWAERIVDLKSLTVMFGLMRCFQALRANYSIEFKEAMTDNAAEFGGPNPSDPSTCTNPVRRLLAEMGIKHRRTKPYRPQTNGKIERFWRTLNEDFLEGSDFNTHEEFDMELLKYLIYYNELRPHQGIDGKKPIEMIGEKNE